MKYLFERKGKLTEYKFIAVDFIVILLFVISLLSENNSNPLEFILSLLCGGIVILLFLIRSNKRTRTIVLYAALYVYAAYDITLARTATEIYPKMTAQETNIKVI